MNSEITANYRTYFQQKAEIETLQDYDKVSRSEI